MEIMKRLVQEEEGQGMVEYALIIALVSIGAVVVLGQFKTEIVGVFTNIKDTLAANN